MHRILVRAAVLGLLASGPAGADIDYLCDGFGDVDVSVTRAETEDSVTVVFLCTGCDGRRITLDGTGEDGVYAGEDMEFRAHAGGAALRTGGVTGTCVVLEAGADEPDPVPGIEGLSMGGNLRTGPGTEFEDVGGLAERTPITLLQDTGVALDGFTWWLIETPTGQRAYHWGGIMCVPGQDLPGIAGGC